MGCRRHVRVATNGNKRFIDLLSSELSKSSSYHGSKAYEYE